MNDYDFFMSGEEHDSKPELFLFEDILINFKFLSHD